MSISDAIVGGDLVQEGEPSRPWQDELKEFISKPIVKSALALVALVVVAFLPLFSYVYQLWFVEKDSYYSHGAFIPVIAAYLIYDNRQHLKQIPFKPNILGLIGVLVAGPIVWVASRTTQFAPLSILFVITLISSVLFIGGWKWVKATVLPILYLLFGLPIWQSVIDNYTNPLQTISTKAAFALLKMASADTLKIDETTLMVRQFELNVGVPCSGLKLILAVSAFMAFFMMLAKLNWWKNIVLVALVLPLCILINGLRIAMIGIVGGQFGPEAGHQFHDYSGYISLIVCFFLLKKITSLMGWN